MYADDVASAIVQSDVRRLIAGLRNAQLVDKAFGNAQQVPKSFNFVVLPGLRMGSFFRRNPAAQKKTDRLFTLSWRPCRSWTVDDILLASSLPCASEDKI